MLYDDVHNNFVFSIDGILKFWCKNYEKCELVSYDKI